MIRHTGKLIWNQRKSNTWIAAELFFVFIILWFIVDELLVTAKVFLAPQGFDIEHVYQVDLGFEIEKDNSTIGESLLLLLERLKKCPGVEAACIGRAAIPFDGTNLYMSIYPQTKDSTLQKSITTKVNRITPGYMDVFKFQLADRKTNWAEKLSNGKMVASYDLIEKIKSQGGNPEMGISYSIDNPSENQMMISGVTTPFRATRFSKNAIWAFEEWTETEILKENNPFVKFVIRVKPEADKEFEAFFIEHMQNQLSVGIFYLMGLTSYKDKRMAFEYLTGEKAEAEKKLAISFFLLINIFLGIIATFWYRTSQRKGEIGVRLAMGSSKNKVKRLIKQEGVLLLTFIFLPAMIVCLNAQLLELNNQYYMDYSPERFIISILVTYTLILIMILSGTAIPAHKASRLQPTEALHNE